MAAGLSQIYGIDIPEVKSNPFKVATVSEYSDALFSGVKVWSDRYIVSPLVKLTGNNGGGFVSLFVMCVCICVFVRSELTVIALAVPLSLLALASSRLGIEKKKGHSGVRILFGVITVMVIGAFWVFVVMSGQPQFFGIDDITFENAEYQTDVVLMSFSGLKYLVVIAVGLATLLPNTEWPARVYSRLGKKFRALCDYGIMISLHHPNNREVFRIRFFDQSLQTAIRLFL